MKEDAFAFCADLCRTDRMGTLGVKHLELPAVALTHQGSNFAGVYGEGILHHPEGIDLLPASIDLASMELRLISAMSRYPGVKFVLISPVELKVPEYIIEDVLIPAGCEYVETTDLEAVMPQLDVLYMTRVQQERFFNEADYLRLRDSYILNPPKLVDAKKDLIILHPLPRVNEISVAVDDEPRACYFKQALYAKYIRMALILKLLEIEVK